MAEPVPPPPQLGRPGTGLLRSPAEFPTTSWPWPGGRAGFLVDTEAAAEPVAKLAEALDRLNHTILRLERDAGIQPPAEDHVSRRLAANQYRMLVNASEYVRDLRERVRAARDALRQQIASYAEIDDPRLFRS